MSVEGYKSFNSVYYGVSTSGRAIRVGIDGESYWIPNFAIHEDSQIRLGSHHKSGQILIREDIAEEKGVGELTTGGTGVGIPLKRHKLPEPPDLIPAPRIQEMLQRAEAASGWVVSSQEELLNKEGEILAIFAEEIDSRDMEFPVLASRFLLDLLDENNRLRQWVQDALKTRKRRTR